MDLSTYGEVNTASEERNIKWRMETFRHTEDRMYQRGKPNKPIIVIRTTKKHAKGIPNLQITIEILLAY